MADRIVLIRHGETEWSRDHRHTGRTDLPLTPRGEEQAKALATALAPYDFSLVLTSPLLRARRTAELAGLSAEVEPDLAEWDYGDGEGLTTAELEARQPGWVIWQHGPPGGESPADVATRADRVLARVERDSAEDATVCLLAHGHLLRMLVARWLDLAPAGGSYFRLGTAALSELGREHGRPVLMLWNSPVRAHEPAGEPHDT